MRTHRTYALTFALLYSLTFLLSWSQPDWVDALRNFAFDTFQRVAAPPYDPDAPVRIVAIDERSLRALGQWPWPRTRLAEMVDRLQALGASAIAFDIIFAEPDRLSLENVLETLPEGELATELRLHGTGEPNDVRFARALAAGPSALGVTAADEGPSQPAFPTKAGMAVAGDPPQDFLPGYASVVLPVPVLSDAAGGLGATNWLPDRDQVVRRIPLLVRYRDAVIPSLALESLRLAQGASSYVLRGSNASGVTAFGRPTGMNAVKVGDIEIATDGDGGIRPRYTHQTAARYISAADLLAGHVAADQVRGRIVLVGTTANGLGDTRSTPLDPVVPGVEIHAELIEQMLSGGILSRPDWALGFEIFVAFAFLTVLALSLTRLAPALAALLSAVTIAALGTGSWIAFSRYGLLLDATFPCVVIAVAHLSGTSILWDEGLQAERRVRRAFGKYVAPAVVARIAANPKLLVLSGETRELTMLFCDVRSFSTISEGLTAREVAQFLNDYLTPMTDVILGQEGTIDKYIGDAIVAFWNAPLDVPDHSRRAVQAALDMRAALRRYNDGRAAKTVDDLRIGIGLNVGPCSVGNMGSLQRFDYSALGDPMNVAARLEALTKTYAVDVLATEDLVARTPGFAWLEVDAVKVKGRSAVTRLFTLFGDEAHATSGPFKAQAERHGAMLAAAEAKRFRDAEGAARDLAARVPAWSGLYDDLTGRYAERSTGVDRATALPETNLSPPSG